MMNKLDPRKNVLAMLVALVLAVAVAGCAGTSTEEPSTDPGDSAEDDCGCAEGDIDCKEKCLRENTP